jgi:hypothetical protein
MHRYYLCTVPWTDTNPLIAFLDFLLSEILQASSIEPSIGKKPNVIHEQILGFPYDLILVLTRLVSLVLYYYILKIFFIKVKEAL